MTEQKGTDTKELDWLKYSSMKIQEVTPNVAIYWEKWKTIYQTTSKYTKTPPQGAFLDKVNPDIDDFTAESVVYQFEMFKL